MKEFQRIRDLFFLGLVATMSGCPAVPGPKVRSVEIVGNEEISDRTILGGLVTKGPQGFVFSRPTPYRAASVEGDIQRIEGFYARRGFFDAEVTAVEVARVNADEVRVRFVVDEGPATRVARVEVSGAPQEVADRLKVGEVFDHERYEAVRDEIRDAYIIRGHAYAQVRGEVAVNRDRAQAEIYLQVDPGPIVRFGETEIRGLEQVPESAVRNRLAWRPGDVVTPERITMTRGRLQRLGLIGSVRLDLDQEVTDVADVRMQIREGTRSEVRLGGGFAFDDVTWEARLLAGYRRYGFLAPMNELRLEVRPAYRILRAETGQRFFAGEARAELIRHDFLFPRVEGTARAAVERFEIEAYGFQGPQGRLLVGRPFLGDTLFVGAGWRLDYLTFFRVHPELAEALADPMRIGIFDQVISLDRRDDIIAPRRGYFADLRLEQGSSAAGGEFDYLRVVSDARGYLPLGEKLVAAGRVRHGRVVTGELPIPRRLFAGGAVSHRGFPQRQLSPFATDPEFGTVPVGGEQLSEGSVELRVNVFKFWDQWVGVVGFLDGGDVTAGGVDIDYRNLHWAAGAGLRYNTIVGPIRFDVGYRLNRFGPGEPRPGERFAFHISLGEAF